MTLNVAQPSAIDVLLTRRSIKAREMADPGPDRRAMELILEAGRRVPDHGKLTPWRFFVFTGEARDALGEIIRAAYLAEEEAPSQATAKGLSTYASQAPALVVLASTPSDAKPIPEWEQRLSAGCAGMAMLAAAHTLGYVGQWLTGWPAYSEGVKQHLGLGGMDRIAGFLFFGSQKDVPEERDRPAPQEVVQWFERRDEVLAPPDRR